MSVRGLLALNPPPLALRYHSHINFGEQPPTRQVAALLPSTKTTKIRFSTIYGRTIYKSLSLFARPEERWTKNNKEQQQHSKETMIIGPQTKVAVAPKGASYVFSPWEAPDRARQGALEIPFVAHLHDMLLWPNRCRRGSYSRKSSVQK